MIAMPIRRSLARAALLFVASWASACATSRPAVREARREEERTERVPVVIAPAPTPAPVRPAPPPPPALTPAPPQPLSALATGSGGHHAEVVEVVDDVLFAPGLPALDAAARATLDELTSRLRRQASPFVLEVQGHADSAGGDADNIHIGLLRAETVRSYLNRVGGIPLDRIAIVSLGASQPVADNSTREGRARNRRAVVLVLR